MIATPITDRIFEPLSTPSPAETAFRLHVAKDTWDFDAVLQEGVTTYKGLALRVSKPHVGKVGTYVFTMKEEADTKGWFALYFAKPKTQRERNTPIDQPIEEMKEPRTPWPAVLDGKCIPRKDDHFRVGAPYIADGYTARGTVTAPRRWMDFQFKRLANDGPCKHRTTRYLSEVPWGEGEIGMARSPQPREIRWNWHTEAGSTGPCLHEEQIIPGFVDTYRVLSGLGTMSSIAGPMVKAQNIPATNMVDWAKYEIVTIEKVAGQYLKTVVEVFPPFTVEELKAGY